MIKLLSLSQSSSLPLLLPVSLPASLSVTEWQKQPNHRIKNKRGDNMKFALKHHEKSGESSQKAIKNYTDCPVDLPYKGHLMTQVKPQLIAVLPKHSQAM